MQLDVIMGGPGSEASVSRKSGRSVAAAARAAGCDVLEIEISKRLDPSLLRSGSVVFNLVHGEYGEDGRLQAELDALGVPYVGSDATSSRLCMDKQATKQRLASAGLPVPWGLVLDPAQVPAAMARLQPGLDYVLKPQADGSSVGVHLFSGPEGLAEAVAAVGRELGAIPLLVERRLRGDEFTVGLIEDDEGWRVLPPIRVAAAQGFYDFQAKYLRDDTDYDFGIPVAIAGNLQSLAKAATVACGCRDLVRVDIMADQDGSLSILELNTLPGFTDHSLVPKAAARIGIDMPNLVRSLAERAAQRGRKRA